ncbi:hypothetical protein OOK44_38165 [Streptomyces cellulosae]|uniref:hypothetical protein n=1 Tax=Streptomyces cellulosae TaxID=1968 RepID=UPI00224F0BF7|nr:hypothetical protein [Streptomyces cellulosae]MCX4482203.1 hypothetical protein [Streptomyces cellulosae]
MNTPQHLPEPEPVHAWAEDLAHDQLVTLTRARLEAAQRAAEAAEEATVQIGYVQLARDLADGTGGPGA